MPKKITAAEFEKLQIPESALQVFVDNLKNAEAVDLLEDMEEADAKSK